MALVAIVGRPNVGKSTFFNRLTETRAAIVHDEPGVTRDRIYGEALWNGVTFSVVDTGGFVPRSEDRFEAAIREQVHIALQEADVILLVVDVTVGITAIDEEMASMLRASDKPVIVVANKADNESRRWESSTFYELGVGEVFPISAVNASGTGDLLDAVVEALPRDEPEEENPDLVRIAVIGRPNVGKSSLTNALIGEERSIVTEISGTTRDAIHSPLKYNGRDLLLVDTAGLRRRTKVHENIEFYSFLRTQRAIEDGDVCVLLLDAQAGLESQDIAILKHAEELRKGLVIAVNKWDLLEKETNTARDYARDIQDRLRTLEYVPIIFISALTRQRVGKVLETAIQVADNRKMRVSTSKLNEFLESALADHHPPTYRGQYVRIKYASQVQASPPVFAFFCNHPKGVSESYRRYLENRLRSTFGFDGVPLTLVFKQK